jgi:hypothetical protein
MAYYIKRGKPNPNEVDAIQALTRSLPAEWAILTNIPGRVMRSETDTCLIGPRGIIVIELKSWRGNIIAHRMAPWGGAEDEENPLDQAEGASKNLKSYLVKNGISRVYVGFVVILTHPSCTLRRSHEDLESQAGLLADAPDLIERHLAWLQTQVRGLQPLSLDTLTRILGAFDIVDLDVELASVWQGKQPPPPPPDTASGYLATIIAFTRLLAGRLQIIFALCGLVLAIWLAISLFPRAISLVDSVHVPRSLVRFPIREGAVTFHGCADYLRKNFLYLFGFAATLFLFASTFQFRRVRNFGVAVIGVMCLVIGIDFANRHVLPGWETLQNNARAERIKAEEAQRAKPISGVTPASGWSEWYNVPYEQQLTIRGSVRYQCGYGLFEPAPNQTRDAPCENLNWIRFAATTGKPESFEVDFSPK